MGAILVIALLAVLVWIGRPMQSAHLARAVASPSPSATPVAHPLPDAWDLDSDIGSVMVLSWRAAVDWSVVKAELVNDQIGGVLLFTPNFGGTPDGMKGWSDRLQQLASTVCLGHPILVMVDQEGGAVANVKAGWSPPWPAVMGTAGPDHVRDLERANGQGLRAAGVGLNLAPVADVRTNPRDAITGARSFGGNPAAVAPLVGAAVQGLHVGGVGAV